MPASSLDELGLRGDAELYRAFRGTHLTPNVLDEMELWQIAVLMDADLGEVMDWEPTEADLARQKAFAERPQDGDITQMVMNQMGIKVT